MKEERIYQTCIILATVGIGLIHASSIYLEPQSIQINEIERSQQGQKITLIGNITKSHIAKGHTFFSLEDETAEIEIAYFNNETKLEKDDSVRVEGTISMNEGQMQIIADELKIRERS